MSSIGRSVRLQRYAAGAARKQQANRERTKQARQ
jgi:hypothetical protein